MSASLIRSIWWEIREHSIRNSWLPLASKTAKVGTVTTPQPCHFHSSRALVPHAVALTSLPHLVHTRLVSTCQLNIFHMAVTHPRGSVELGSVTKTISKYSSNLLYMIWDP